MDGRRLGATAIHACVTPTRTVTLELEGRHGIEEDCCMTLVARLKVTLSDVEPQVLRRFDVALKIKLNRLHDVIQAAMGWTDSHLYEFRAGGSG